MRPWMGKVFWIARWVVNSPPTQAHVKPGQGGHSKMIIASLTFGLFVGAIDCLTVLCCVELGGCREQVEIFRHAFPCYFPNGCFSLNVLFFFSVMNAGLKCLSDYTIKSWSGVCQQQSKSVPPVSIIFHLIDWTHDRQGQVNIHTNSRSGVASERETWPPRLWR